MRFAYLLFAHDNPAHLAALADELCPPGSADFIVLHIDARSPLRHQAAALAAANPAIRLVVDPVPVYWGHPNMVDAIRRLLRTAMAEPFTHAHLLSGSDWPLASRERRAAEIGDRCWIEAVPGVQSERMEVRRLDTRLLRPDPARPLEWYAARLLRAVSMRLPRRKDTPFGPWHKGSCWWSLPRDVCEQVRASLDEGLAKGRFRGTVVADEHAVQTIVARHFPHRIERHRHFMRWHEGHGSPAWLTVEDWQDALASDAWFARKVALPRDTFVLRRDA